MLVRYQGNLPKQAKIDDAGYDLCAIEDDVVFIGTAKRIKTGFSMKMPVGYAGLVCSRSGLALKRGVFVLNAPGIIDCHYTGDVGVILYNASGSAFDIQAGDRIAQLVFVKVEHPEFESVEVLPETERGSGGFGSTGK